MWITLGCLAVYLVIGIFVIVSTWEPEQGGWLWVMLLWPFQLLAKVWP